VLTEQTFFREGLRCWWRCGQWWSLPLASAKLHPLPYQLLFRHGLPALIAARLIARDPSDRYHYLLRAAAASIWAVLVERA